MPWLASIPWPWRYMSMSIVPLMRCSCPVPLAEKHPQSIMFPPPCLTVGMVFLRYRQHSSSSKHGELSWCQRAQFWSHLTFESLANFRRYMCFLEQGDLAGAATRWDLAWSPSKREIDSYFVFLPFANIHTNCCYLLIKLLGDGLVLHPALCRSTILSLTFLDSSLVLAMVESLESDWSIASVDRCLFFL